MKVLLRVVLLFDEFSVNEFARQHSPDPRGGGVITIVAHYVIAVCRNPDFGELV